MLKLPLPDNRKGILDRMLQEKIIVKHERGFTVKNIDALLFVKNMDDFGSKILCDGYVIIRVFSIVKTLIINKILCNGYVMIGNQSHHYRLQLILNSQAGMFFCTIILSAKKSNNHFMPEQQR